MTNSWFPQSAGMDHRHEIAVFLLTGMVIILLEMHGGVWLAHSLKQWELTMEAFKIFKW